MVFNPSLSFLFFTIYHGADKYFENTGKSQQSASFDPTGLCKFLKKNVWSLLVGIYMAGVRFVFIYT